MNFDTRCSLMLMRKNNYTLFKTFIIKKIKLLRSGYAFSYSSNTELLNYDSKRVRVAQNRSFVLAQ